MKHFILSVIVSGLMFGTQALAQDGTQNTIIVTGTRIDADDLKDAPNVTMRVQADFVLFEVGFVNASLERSDRLRDLERAFKRIASDADKRDDIALSVGSAEEASPIETVTFEEAHYDNGQRASFNLVVKVYTRQDDSFDKVRARVEAFIAGVPEYGRTQSYIDDEQYLGITDLDRYRPDLVAAISQEVDLLIDTFLASEVSVSGLEEQTITQTVGPMELEIYIPYTINLVSERD